MCKNRWDGQQTNNSITTNVNGIDPGTTNAVETSTEVVYENGNETIMRTTNITNNNPTVVNIDSTPQAITNYSTEGYDSTGE